MHIYIECDTLCAFVCMSYAYVHTCECVPVCTFVDLCVRHACMRACMCVVLNVVLHHVFVPNIPIHNT